MVRAGVDSEFGAWKVLREQAAVLRVHDLVVVAAGDERGLGDAGQAVELRGVGDAEGCERRELGVASCEVRWGVMVS